MSSLYRAAGLFLMIMFGSTVQAAVTTYYPTSSDSYDYYYGYPYMAVAGDNVVGSREATGLPAVNQVRFYTVIDQTEHISCYPELLFYFNNEYLGYVELDPYYSYTYIDATVSVSLSDASSHQLEIELEDTIYDYWCWYSWVEILDNQSYITMDLVGADVDSDGYYDEDYYGDDCDDSNSNVHPNATESCNGIDDNCDGNVDEGVKSTWYRDSDGDGYGVSSNTTEACSRPSGYASQYGDCDDGDASIYPSAPESCNGTDDDCDGSVDEGVTTTYYYDSDGDGFGVSSSTTQACSKPSGYSTVAGDCDNNDSSVYPNASELCDGKDNDCDGSTDEGVLSTYYQDNDSDGYGQSGSSTQACSKPSGYASVGGDCDDGSSGVNPGATEVCNGYDDDCDSSVDEGVTNVYYEDGDGDGYGIGSSTTTGCSRPSGYASVAGDCDDSSASVYPSAPELCDGLDNDCDDSVDEGVLTTYYLDSDGDGYGLTNSTQQACSKPSSYAALSGDCDDSNAAVNPGATEACNDIDDDCDGGTDEGLDVTWYLDQDGDGFGVAGSTTSDCAQPSGYAAVAGDCNDSDASIYPNAGEQCDGKDNDCDGSIDESVQTTWYADGDGDGYGVASSTLEQCSKPSGYAGVSGDCDDGNADINPGETEVCNDVDDDCDGAIDESLKTTYYKDNDGDGFGVAGQTTEACTKPSGYASVAGDCDDSSEATYPDAPEKCDGQDNDCDSTVDEGVKTTFYQDADGDGYGVNGSTTQACEKPDGYASTAGDCDDGNEGVNPGASESCNGIDDDCDSSIDEGQKTTYYQDDDGDGYGQSASTTDACSQPSGYAQQGGDCADDDESIHPQAPEQCDGKDNDCDGTTDENVKTVYYRDSDADGYGVGTATLEACSTPSGYASDPGDCDDSDASVNPGASEVCNGKDDDCDAAVDEGVKSTWYADSDDDGFGDPVRPADACSAPNGYVGNNLDCNDADPNTNPDASEVCDGRDNDCDGTKDEGVKSTFYADNDGDSYGDASDTQQACERPVGYVTNSSDCDDSMASVNPAATETCNGIDDNCDTAVDEGVQTRFYADLDEDGYGDDDNATLACSMPDGYTETSGDCDDGDSSIYPDAPETCNELDDDCDDQIDEGVQTTYFADEDADGYGDSSAVTLACTLPDGYVEDDTDCDDANADISPASTEICGDTIDQDCDGYDLGCDVVDADGDGFSPAQGDCDDANNQAYPGAPELCDDADNDCNGITDDLDADGDGYVAADCSGRDCDDALAEVNPGATEVCDGLDNNCSGVADDVDSDGDGYVDIACDGDDCDDLDPKVNPGAAESCDGRDNDCNGIDDDQDSDGDGYIATLCNGTDCNDTDPNIHPDATEIENGVDDNCNGFVDEGFDAFDDDGDGYSENLGDCNDSDPSVYPGAEDIPEDGIDQDCDGQDAVADDTPVDDTPVGDDDTSVGDDDTSGTGDDDTSIIGDDDTSIGDDDTSVIGDDDTAGTGDDDTFGVGDDDTADVGDDDTAGVGDDDTAGAGDDDTWTAGDDDTFGVGDDDTWTAGDDDTYDPGDDDTWSAGDDDTIGDDDTEPDDGDPNTPTATPGGEDPTVPGSCNCAIPGSGGTGSSGMLLLLFSGALACLGVKRRRGSKSL